MSLCQVPQDHGQVLVVFAHEYNKYLSLANRIDISADCLVSTCNTCRYICFLSHELAIGLLGNRLVDALRLLELGPQIEVGLRLVMGDGIGIILLLCVCMKDGIRLGADS